MSSLSSVDDGGVFEDAEDFSRAVVGMVEIDAEQRAKLCLYRDLLLRWNSRMNLMSGGDVRRFWSRHCWESVQLLRFFPRDGCSVCDLGSGAGFPGLVLALLLRNHRFTLIESRLKKASFLRHVSRETCTSVNVETTRVEDKPRATDIVVSRAFASLEKTLQYLQEWRIGKQRGEQNSEQNSEQIGERNNTFRALLLKGSRWQHELTQARQSWTIQASVERLPQNIGRTKRSPNGSLNRSPDGSPDEQSSEKSSCVVLKLKTWSRDRTDSQSC